MLIDFLNALLPRQHQVSNLHFKNTEQLGLADHDRKAIYDIYCENERGEKFIVELQRAKQTFFKERTLYYATFPIREQAEKGAWNFNLKAVYCIGILDFTFDDGESQPARSEFLHTIKLKNQHGKAFYEKLTFLYLEMPNFTKSENELESRLDQWLYFIKNLENFEAMPTIFKDNVFEQAFEKAELSNMGANERNKYEASLKVYRDLKNVIDTAYDEGKAEGKEEGKAEGRQEGEVQMQLKVARQLKSLGLAVEFIMQATGLSAAAIENL